MAANTQGDLSIQLHQALTPLVGPQDAVMVTSPQDTPLISIHSDRLLVPASILKLITALAALDRLGADYRFQTEFYQDHDDNLIIKGYGDPLLVSERMTDIAATLAQRLPSYHHLIVDDSYFEDGLVIPGRSVSEEPYDAPNGALCVNFNTVAFRREKGRWLSGEPQTPLLSEVIPKIEASGLSAGRITLAANSAEALEYTGGLFRHFFDRAGLFASGEVKRGRVRPEHDRLVWRYRSASDLRQVIQALLEFSNNFVANQMLLVMGAETYGPPATMGKGLRVLRQYCRQQLGMVSGRIVEASGISRQNRISAGTMMAALARFEHYHPLLRKSPTGQLYKTGHLKGVRTRAGYIDAGPKGRFRFVVILNTPGKTTHAIMRRIERALR